MAIRRSLYGMDRPDELAIGKRTRHLINYGGAVHSAILNQAPATITPGPAPEWIAAHDRALRVTAIARQVPTPRLIANRPVPRSANHHYDSVKSLSLTTEGSTFYFY